MSMNQITEECPVYHDQIYDDMGKRAQVQEQW